MKLDLSENPLGFNGIDLIASALSKTSPTLTSLNLARTNPFVYQSKVFSASVGRVIV